MSAIPFLFNRQIGSKLRSGSTLNLDNVISRLVCYKKDIFTVHGEETEVPPFVCKFRKDAQSDLLAVCNEDGEILLYDTLRKNQEALIKTFAAHHNAIFDICWVPDKFHLITGSGDHLAVLWDMSQCKRISVFKQHTASIKSIDVSREQSAILATGSRDGSINVWDTRTNVFSGGFLRPVVNICQAHGRKNLVHIGRKSVQKDSISSVSAVAFQDINNLASAGVADGIVKIWDLRKTYISNAKHLPSPRYQMDYSQDGKIGHGCTSLVFDSRFKSLYACSTKNKIFKFDCHSYTKEAVTYDGFQCSTYFIKLDLSHDDQYLLCGSSDEKAYIWKTSKPGLPIMQLASHSAEVTSVSWSPYDITKVATCGDDYKVVIWKVADTETASINENVHSIAEIYSESPKNFHSPIIQNTVLSSTTASKSSAIKSPVESTQTPSKPSVRVITHFFSPLTPTSVHKLPNHNENQFSTNENISLPSTSKSPNKNIVDASPQILTPCNHVNKSNIHQSPDDCSSEVQTSPEQNSSPEQKRTVTNFFTSTSEQNKENASTDFSPETPSKPNYVHQSKRKVPSRHSTSTVKRRRTDSSKKNKKVVNEEKKAVPGKTIMNYFSVVLSVDNTE